MIKKTFFFGNPASLRVKNNQLLIKRKDKEDRNVPIEDIGFLIIDHYGVTISHGALGALLENNASIITTNEKHMPEGMFLPLAGNSEQNERFRYQLNASEPLKKQLWKQTVKAKIQNQSGLLKQFGLEYEFLNKTYKKVLSGDSGNHESQAARYYWGVLFDLFLFKRYRYGKPPNNLLNYGYAILRAVIARALAGSGLLPGLGIHHRNRYNAYPLADDIMEPYRPYVDEIVWNLAMNEYDISELTADIKRELLEIPNIPVKLNEQPLSLMLAASRTTASLHRCFSGDSRKLIYPSI